MKTKIFVVKKSGNEYYKIDEIKYKNKESLSLIKYKKHCIPIPPKNPYTLSTDKVKVLFFDIDNKQYVTFEKTDLGLSTEFLDSLFNRNIVGQLAKAVKKATDGDKTNFDFVKTAIICGISALGGYLIGVGGF